MKYSYEQAGSFSSSTRAYLYLYFCLVHSFQQLLHIVVPGVAVGTIMYLHLYLWSYLHLYLYLYFCAQTPSCHSTLCLVGPWWHINNVSVSPLIVYNQPTYHPPSHQATSIRQQAPTPCAIRIPKIKQIAIDAIFGPTTMSLPLSNTHPTTQPPTDPSGKQLSNNKRERHAP